jgi:hypothetical protein
MSRTNSGGATVLPRGEGAAGGQVPIRRVQLAATTAHRHITVAETGGTGRPPCSATIEDKPGSKPALVAALTIGI